MQAVVAELDRQHPARVAVEAVEQGCRAAPELRVLLTGAVAVVVLVAQAARVVRVL